VTTAVKEPELLLSGFVKRVWYFNEHVRSQEPIVVLVT